MQDMSMENKLKQVGKAFNIAGDFISFEEIKVGNVNRTYRVNYVRDEDGKPLEKSYIVQKINTYAFKQPELVMSNIDKVTEHIRKKCPDRKALHFHHTADRKNYVNDADGFWRLFNYVPSITYNVTDNLNVIRNAGRAFGDFQTQLGDFDEAVQAVQLMLGHDMRAHAALRAAQAMRKYVALPDDERADSVPALTCELDKIASEIERIADESGA